ncbi:MAG: GntR family transcriptional regulator [Bacillota bacterium]
MKFFINCRSGVPIYRQLIQQIKNGIVGGFLKPGVQLATVQEITLELTVNPNTVVRAYRELKMRGLLQNIQGLFIGIPHCLVMGKRMHIFD